MFKKLSALLLVVILLRTSFAAADSVLPARRKTIASFFDLTWEEVDEHGSNAYSMFTKEGYASAWKYRLGMVQINGNTISGAINAEKESYLQFVWQHLGQACVTCFPTMDKLQSNHNGELAAATSAPGMTITSSLSSSARRLNKPQHACFMLKQRE